jgi:hypothetical protein
MSSGIAPLTEHPPWSTNVSRPIPWLEAENYLHVKTTSRRRGGSLILLSRPRGHRPNSSPKHGGRRRLYRLYLPTGHP